jgi:surface polysaccharide O-acyltransferase-like enzyme
MRTQSIDTFKGLAILAVVIIHTEPFLAIQAIKNDWYYLGHSIQQISSFAVPFFFVVAGFFFSQGIRKEGLTGRWWLFVKRFSVILLVWIVIRWNFLGGVA